jgi:hypothetical protein
VLPHLQNVAYTWSATAGEVIGSNTQDTVEILMPPAGTRMTISLDI